MSLAIITASYLRPKILRLFCLSMDRIRKESEFKIDVVCVGDKDHKEMLEKHNIIFAYKPNHPVSYKFQKALSIARTLNPKAVMILGSDDIVSTEYVRRAYKWIEMGEDVVGLSTLYFYSTLPDTSGELLRLDKWGRMLGAGKTLSDNLLNSIDWTLWDAPKNSGLDAMASKRIPGGGTIIDEVLVDVKSKTNINKYSLRKSKLQNVNPEIFYDILSEEELNQLKSVINLNII